MESPIESATIELPECREIVDRREYLVERSKGRRVVHLGCVDEGFLGARSANDGLLHAHLARVTAHLVGVDLSHHGLETLAGLVPGDYVEGDVEELTSLPLPDTCDLVIAGELIEHLPNPGRFLSELNTYLGSTGATALITTPNAYSWLGMARFLTLGKEPTHPDHVVMYSPVTMRRELEMAGLEIVAMRAHTWLGATTWKQRVRGVVDRAALAARPWSAVGIVAEVRAG